MSDEKLYTAAEAKNLVAHEVASQRLAAMERLNEERERRTVDELSAIKLQLSALPNLITTQSHAMEKATDELRKDISRDFASKEELNAKFDKLNTKIETNWSKLVLIVSVVTFTGTVVSALASFLIKLMGH